jgi:hypothetical protein
MNASRALAALALCIAACGVIYPEVTTRVKAPPPGRVLEPPPPSDLACVTFAGASIPAKTRDGRNWTRSGGGAPDSFAKLFVNDRELLRTPVESGTLTPTWRRQKVANYRLPRGARYRLELWDRNPINDHPICVTPISDLLDQVGPDTIDIVCEGGARVSLRVAPARALWGLGFSYELGTDGAVAVTRVIEASPAGRAGLFPGERVLEIQGKPVAKMEEGEAMSRVNANAQLGVELLVRGADREHRRLIVKEGAIYPAVGEGVPLE